MKIRDSTFDLINTCKVVFFNSLIEGNNRILKQTYLKDKELYSDGFSQYIDECILEYNKEKLHYFHKIYAPDETYENPKLKDTKLFFEKIN